MEIIPKGVICFLHSYEYLNMIKNMINSEFVSGKKIFYESTEMLNSTMADYEKTIHNSKGALIFGVMGGKLSEGINFSDDMAR